MEDISIQENISLQEKHKSMRKCLLKIYKIRENHHDVSDYDMFLESAAAFLEIVKDHKIFIKPLLKAFKHCKCENVISVLYHLSSFLKLDKFFISRKTMRKHFKSTIIRHGMMKCLNAYNLDFFDYKIKKIIEKGGCFKFHDFFERIKLNEKFFGDILFNEDYKNLHFQLDVIINCRFSYNLKYFFKFLGSNLKIVAFKTFEAFNIIFQEYETNADINKAYITNYIDFPCNIFIENPIHFLSFASVFLEEKEMIIKTLDSNIYGDKELAFLQAILFKYVQCDIELTIEDLSKINVCFRRKVETNVKNMGTVENFNFLFQKSTRKDICDCYEF